MTKYLVVVAIVTAIVLAACGAAWLSIQAMKFFDKRKDSGKSNRFIIIAMVVVGILGYSAIITFA